MWLHLLVAKLLHFHACLINAGSYMYNSYAIPQPFFVLATFFFFFYIIIPNACYYFLFFFFFSSRRFNDFDHITLNPRDVLWTNKILFEIWFVTSTSLINCFYSNVMVDIIIIIIFLFKNILKLYFYFIFLKVIFNIV